MELSIQTITPSSDRNVGVKCVIRYAFVETRWGKILLAAAAQGVCSLLFCDAQEDATLAELWQQWPGAELKEGLAEAQAVIDRFSSATEDRATPPLELLVQGTPFQVDVWRALAAVPRGERISYTALAQRASHPTAIRAVASAVARNPISLLIPCHRIVRLGGNIGQYRWGSARKEALLAYEDSLSRK